MKTFEDSQILLTGNVCVYCNRLIVLVGRVFANGLGNLGFIPGRVIPKTLKMLFDTFLQYKVRIKGKVEQSGEKVAPLPYISV